MGISGRQGLRGEREQGLVLSFGLREQLPDLCEAAQARSLSPLFAFVELTVLRNVPCRSASGRAEGLRRGGRARGSVAQMLAGKMPSYGWFGSAHAPDESRSSLST